MTSKIYHFLPPVLVLDTRCYTPIVIEKETVLEPYKDHYTIF